MSYSTRKKKRHCQICNEIKYTRRRLSICFEKNNTYINRIRSNKTCRYESIEHKQNYHLMMCTDCYMKYDWVYKKMQRYVRMFSNLHEKKYLKNPDDILSFMYVSRHRNWY